jgi:putative copper resistance protein D
MRRFLPLPILALLLAAPFPVLAHGTEAPSPTFPSVLLAWAFDPLAISMLVLAGVAYGWAVRRVNRAHPENPHPVHRSWLFGGGLAAIGVALLSPIEAYEGMLFSVHMVQHMLLELVAAPLLLAAAPITLALRASGPSVRKGLLRVLQSRIVHVISFPVIAWLVFAAVNWGWHFSVLYDQALENQALHYFQHATFLGAALLFWWPAIGVDPSPWRLPHPVRLLYLFMAMPQNSFLGVALLSASTVLYPHYLTNVREWGPSPLEDQQLGGVIMWVVGDLAFLAGMAVVVVLWMRHEERRTIRLDARLAADRAARGEEAWTPRGASDQRRVDYGEPSGQRKAQEGVGGHRREEQSQIADRVAEEADRSTSAGGIGAEAKGAPQEERAQHDRGHQVDPAHPGGR